MLKQWIFDNLIVKEYENRIEMGNHAAAEAANCLRKLLLEKDEVNCMFAAAPSQKEFLEVLSNQNDIDWTRINVFHMDEYCGLAQRSMGSFSYFLCNSIFDKLNFKSIHLINGMADPEDECRRYEEILRKYPLDIVFMGIGENGHIAFNDPPVADFMDKSWVKQVKLDETCRKQQVNDGCFSSLEEVPTHAITVTVPGLMRAEYHFCIVPGIRKAQAVKDTLKGPIVESCPASILRKQEHACLYLDRKAASKL